MSGSPPSAAWCAARLPVTGAGPPAAGSGRTMRPTSPPPARWFCVLTGALVCVLGPAVSVRRAARSPGSWGWSWGDGSPAVCSLLCGGDKGRGACGLVFAAPETRSRPEGGVGSPSRLVPSRAAWSPFCVRIWDTRRGAAGKS